MPTLIRTVLLTVLVVFTLSPNLVLAQSTEIISDKNIANARLAYLDGDYATALPVIIPAAKQGSPIAQNILALMYEYGDGVERDLTKAVQWYEKAVEQDFVFALLNLGDLYRFGYSDFPTDVAKAATLYDRAIELDSDMAMYERGRMFEAGVEGAPDPEKAIYYYQMAADKGHAEAMANLGNFYVSGTGVDVDYERALEIFRTGAEGGSPLAMSNLGAMYENGYAVETDIVAAAALYETAAWQGVTKAMVNLSSIRLTGPEGLRDPADAYAWCHAALEWPNAVDVNKNEQTRYEPECAYVDSQLDDAQKREGRRLLAEYLP